MEISWLGHSCFRLKARDVTLITDPYMDATWGYPALTAAANIVTVSHDDPHHGHTQAVSGSPRVVRGPGEYEIGGVMITGIRTARRAPAGEALGRNTVYVFQVEDVRFCHLGDIGSPLTPEELEYVQDSEVLLIPVGGFCTINGAEAAKMAAQIEPRVIIPMHYATAETEGHLELEGLDRFRREMGVTEQLAQSRFSVSSTSLPLEPTVVILERRS